MSARSLWGFFEAKGIVWLGNRFRGIKDWERSLSCHRTLLEAELLSLKQGFHGFVCFPGFSETLKRGEHPSYTESRLKPQCWQCHTSLKNVLKWPLISSWNRISPITCSLFLRWWQLLLISSETVWARHIGLWIIFIVVSFSSRLTLFALVACVCGCCRENLCACRGQCSPLLFFSCPGYSPHSAT